MHDLVHDLAQYVARNECLNALGAITKPIPVTIWHVSIKLPIDCRHLNRAKKLRTLIYPSGGRDRKPLGPKIVRLRCLRVLENCSFDEYSFFPESKRIGKLKQLRCLHFSNVMNLPKSLCKLINLEYLDLLGSGVTELPKDVEKLINLRYLRLVVCLKDLSERFCRLTSLRTLYLVYCNSTSLGEGIELLSCLRELVLWYCWDLN